MLGRALQNMLPGALFLDRKACDLREKEQVDRFFEAHRPQKVLHLAAVVGGVKLNAEKNAQLFAENVLINTNVLCAAQRFHVQRLVSVLSTCALPVSDAPCSENDLQEGMPYAGNAGYGYAKRMLDVHTRLIAKESGLQFSTVMPVTMYGPHDDFDVETGHVIAALIRKCVLARNEKKEFHVWGSGEAVRQFIHCDDVARILVQELEHFNGSGTMILAPDNGISIKTLAQDIALAAGFNGTIYFDKDMPEGQRVKIAQSVCFAGRYPEFSFTSLQDGLRQTFAWFESRYSLPVGK